jgi:ribosomal protein S12 methylthiotransferase accessory factor
MERFGELCGRAAQALAQAGAAPDAAVRSLLAALEYDRDGGPVAAAERARLLRAAASFVRLFQVAAPEAPGLVFLGGEIDARLGAAGRLQRWSITGTGLTLRAAFESCVGEGVERLSLIAEAEDRVVPGMLADHAAGFEPMTLEALAAIVPANERIDWLAGTRIGDGRPALLPADLCLARDSATRGFAPPYPIGIGCAAGPSFDAAVLHALLEAVERDAACLWWQGGARGRLIRPQDAANAEAAGLLAALRRGREDRRTWLLDITTDLRIPCAAAVSSGADGFGFACGTAARATLRQAVRSALLEMCQMEVAHDIVELKRRESGEARFNDVDRAHLRRWGEVDTQACALLHPLPPEAASADIEADSPAETLRQIAGRLAQRGIEAFAVDLTRLRFDIPVARIIAPAMEKASSGRAGARLKAMIDRTGGGESYTRGIPLM